ncbi:AI-2E family transporter [Dubosiella newyorkensis]|uniref:AI-2E family transporter n=2 Tax=Dubosiella newyorkensis TaxID=1862672 RepID=UPI0023564B71|nr:AI-2E family transporter [Dubosiella newyorkensis]MCI9040757.1 AI-2E family transporter [Dubosiella newyorkensis]
MRSEKINWKLLLSITALVILVLRLDQVLALLKTFWGAISSLVFGAMLAFVINLIMRPIEDFLSKSHSKFILKSKRALALLLSLVIVILLLAALVWLVVPSLIEAGEVMVKVLPGYFSETETFFKKLFADNPQIVAYIETMHIDWEQVVKNFVHFTTTGVSNMLGSAVGMVGTVVTSIVNLIIVIIFAIYVLLDKQRFVRLYHRACNLWLKPETEQKITRALYIIYDSFSSFICGQCLEALILGSTCALGMFILKLPYPLMIGTLVGVINIIPMIGAYIGGAIGMFMVFTVSPWLSVVFLIYLCILQQFESNIIYPRVVGSQVGLPGIYVMITVVVGGSLAGVPGMFLGIPIMASIYKLARIHFENEEKKKEEKDHEKEVYE